MSKNPRSNAPSPRPGAARPPGTRPANVTGSARARPTTQPTSVPASRRTRRLGIVSIALVVAIVVTLVAVRIERGGGSPSASSPSAVSPAAGTPVPAALLAKLASIPISTLNEAPTGGLVASPARLSDPALTAGGKPDLLYIGAEFCPICAAERWAVYVALSEFGSFGSEPGRIHSSVRDGDIDTLTFYKSTFSSPYLAFTPLETTTNQPDGDYYKTLQTPTADQLNLWESHTGSPPSFPWLDFGGQMQLASCQYNPAVLEGQSFDSIISQIGNNSTTLGADIDAAAKVLIQSICGTLTSGQPANVCRAIGVG